ncbi:putative transcriptional regulator [Novosphingobium chloroacetimidivorans]|uniref:Putative transcriptional regulator n=1 Tax=Novosphingobium chloroacetimidivorans TaxID=1428314 RepID=A0A7W7KDB1_9SPHN|nr:MucR family transcriptional regulator [Novosphingobium chloroacetimidivorans]MBB4860742.1 putative transcriptional regulator [Novosphingobium chloroacetimidivorans]
MNDAGSTPDIAALTVQLLSAYLANNDVPSEDLAGLIRSTRDALSPNAAPLGQAEPETFTPAVTVRKSLASPDHIISLIDGKAYKTLKRHLASHGLTPAEYRARYNLPSNYPMVAQAYAEHRRGIAQKSGLGTRKSADESAALPLQEKPSTNSEELITTQSPSSHEGSPGQRSAVVAEANKAAVSGDAAAYDQVDAGQPSSMPAADQDAATQRESASDTPTVPGSLGEPAAKRTMGKATPAAKKPASEAADGSSKRGGKVKAEPQPTSRDASEGAGEATEGQDVPPSVQKPKRRAKLGLFTSAETTAEQPSDEAVVQSADTEVADEQQPVSTGATKAVTKAPAKRKSTKRMARAPQGSAEPQVGTPDSRDDPA